MASGIRETGSPVELERAWPSRREFIKAGLFLSVGAFLLKGFFGVRRALSWWERPRYEVDGETLLRSYPKRNPSLTWRSTDDGLLLVPSDGGDPTHRLNRVAEVIWNMCDGHHRPYQIARAVTRRFEVPEGTCLRDTLELLTALHSEGLIAI
ncbi:MAG TPA: PqqD family protein [Candidatus Latescibacteria bacterium]|nr:PqqD family protein [Candidatus Latescibacterota bacterium]